MLSAFCSVMAIGAPKDFVWFDGNGAVTVNARNNVSPVTVTAMEMFCEDIRQVTGMKPVRCAADRAAVRVVQLDRDAAGARWLRRCGVPVESIMAVKDAFYIKVTEGVNGRQLAVAGSDGRGTAYGIFELSRLAGVSPWVWWGDVTPEHRSRLTVPGGYMTFQKPSVEYRGIHDGSMEGVKTMREKTDALRQVIYDQRKMLAKYVNKDVTKIPQQFVPYKEVLQIMENGLDIPEDVTLVWCDDNYGYMTRLSDSLQQKRSGGAGVYYHLSYWGRPHDYMWLCTTQPGLVYNEMREAYDMNARKLWIVNVHDLKPAAYDLELFLDMAWNIDCVAPNTLENHLGRWLFRDYGEAAGKALLPAMKEFYRLCGGHEREDVGGTEGENDVPRHVRHHALLASGGADDSVCKERKGLQRHQTLDGLLQQYHGGRPLEALHVHESA